MTKRMERIKSEIRNLYKVDAKKPVNIAKEYTTLYITAVRTFGSWREAVEASGISYEDVRNNKKWNREKICREIRRLKNNNSSLRPSRLRSEGMTDLVSAAEYHFGSWRRAVETCGIEYSFGRGRSASNGHNKNGN